MKLNRAEMIVKEERYIEALRIIAEAEAEAEVKAKEAENKNNEEKSSRPFFRG